MRIKREEELLDLNVRKQIIKEIRSSEEEARRDEAYRRNQIYKDHTKRFVIERLLKQFRASTVEEMSFAVSNVSVLRKVVNKLARVYNNGVSRSISDNEEATERLSELASKLCMDEKFKVTNRYVKLQRNAALYLKPCPYYDMEGNEKWQVKPSVMSPHLYSVVEGYYDRTKPLAFIFSNFEQRDETRVSTYPEQEGRVINTPQAPIKGNQEDETIADSKEDEDDSLDRQTWTYIVWSNKYHFTMNAKGEFLDSQGEIFYPVITESAVDERILNPIQELPVVNYSIDQENSFWSDGGEDMVDGAILINCMLTHFNHILVNQGYGQLVLKGKDLPHTVETGPNRVIRLERASEDDIQADAEFISAQPKLQEFKDNIEMQTALYLTTNDLSTSHISSQLSGGAMFPSGVALLIDKSESMEDVKDQQGLFLDNEPKVWRIINKWNEYFAGEGLLDDEFIELLLPEGFEEDLVVHLGYPQTVFSEEEKLANIEKRKELGLNLDYELLKIDQPNLTDEEAKLKLLEIQKEKLKKMESFSVDQGGDQDGQESNEESGAKEEGEAEEINMMGA